MHKTKNAQRIAMLSKEDQATVTDNMHKKYCWCLDAQFSSWEWT